MAMTNAQLDVINAIAQNDMPKARKAARAAVAEDTSKKNAWDCKRLARLLDPTLNPDLIKLPYKVDGILEAEYPVETFIPERYYLSPREEKLFKHIERMRRVCDELAEMRINYPNTVLLHGASGTGKTMFGRYVACMLGLPFYYLNFSRAVDSLMGKTSQNIAAAFNYICTEPCVFMMNEIDCVSIRRAGGDGGTSGEMNRVTITIMQELDRITGRQIIIGATNRLDVLDDAILRRFSKHHEVTIPQDPKEAQKVISVFLDDAGVKYDKAEILNWCAGHNDKPQAWLIGRTVEAIARSVETGDPFRVIRSDLDERSVRTNQD